MGLSIALKPGAISVLAAPPTIIARNIGCFSKTFIRLILALLNCSSVEVPEGEMAETTTSASFINCRTSVSFTFSQGFLYDALADVACSSE
jgi:hypothetical protein